MEENNSVVWHKIEDDGYPEYYEPLWCSDGILVIPGLLVGRSFNPPERIFKNKTDQGCSTLSGITHWAKRVTPAPPRGGD